jgi:hypothetical protein
MFRLEEPTGAGDFDAGTFSPKLRRFRFFTIQGLVEVGGRNQTFKAG